MSLAKITLIGLNNYIYPKSVFDKLVLPEGIDKQIVVDTIMFEGGEFELLYPNPDFLTDEIGRWGDRYRRTFDKWARALNIEYNPLDNYDRTETETIQDDSNGAYQNTGSSSSEADATSQSNVNGKTSAYNADIMRDDTSSDSDSSDHSEVSASTSDSNTHEEHDTRSRSLRARGNIGVTTSQQMLEAELSISQWNIYKHISDIFIAEFCLMIY